MSTIILHSKAAAVLGGRKPYITAHLKFVAHFIIDELKRKH